MVKRTAWSPLLPSERIPVIAGIFNGYPPESYWRPFCARLGVGLRDYLTLINGGAMEMKTQLGLSNIRLFLAKTLLLTVCSLVMVEIVSTDRQWKIPIAWQKAAEINIVVNIMEFLDIKIMISRFRQSL